MVTYTNKYGESYSDPHASPFTLTGIITCIRFTTVSNLTTAKMCVENKDGKHAVSIWSNEPGYNVDKLIIGAECKFTGILHKQFYNTETGTAYFNDYKAHRVEYIS